MRGRDDRLTGVRAPSLFLPNVTLLCLCCARHTLVVTTMITSPHCTAALPLGHSIQFKPFEDFTEILSTRVVGKNDRH